MQCGGLRFHAVRTPTEVQIVALLETVRTLFGSGDMWDDEPIDRTSLPLDRLARLREVRELFGDAPALADIERLP